MSAVVRLALEAPGHPARQQLVDRETRRPVGLQDAPQTTVP
jgi:hypothetical protein